MIDNDYEGVQKLHCLTEYNEEETMQMFKEEGADKLGQLIDVLISCGRTEDVKRVATDKVIRRTLYREYNID